MEAVLARKSSRRSGTCVRRGCRSSASPGIWAGRTSSLRKFIADAGGKRPTPVSALSCGYRLENERRSPEAWRRATHPCHRRRPGPLAFDGVSGGER